MSFGILVIQCLAVMEEAFARMGRREEFIAYCQQLKEEKKEAIQNLTLTQWYLEPKELSLLFTQTAFADEFNEPVLKSEWEWVNPKGHSSYSLSREAGWLELRAAAGSTLDFNLNAPRLLQTISGDFAVEVKVKAASDDMPPGGGLLIWQDEENFITCERGLNGREQVVLRGRAQGKYAYFGRGMLASEVLTLRLERVGDAISAYCSADGANWFTCGSVRLAAEDSVQVGICAVGYIEWRNWMATAMRFDDFRVMKREGG